MNIVQLHERVRFWVDIVSSTRFESEDIDNALNAAIDNKVRESYDQNLPLNRSDAFQRTQRIRDELGPLVKSLDGDELSVVGHLISLSASDELNFRYLLSLKIQFESASGVIGWQPCFPITYDRKNIISRNPFRRVRSTPNTKIYYIEENGSWRIISSITSYYDIDAVEFFYLSNPAIVNYGIEYDEDKLFTNGNVLYVVEETVYNSVTYKIGSKIIVTGGILSITSGLVVFNYVDCDLRASAHEEISRRAAINCLFTANETAKANSLMQEIIAS